MPGGFVGRPAELNNLRIWSTEVAMGQPQLVFIQGAPGIGKTSLITEFGSTLDGWQQLVIAGYQDERRLPFGMLIRLVGEERFDTWIARHETTTDGLDPFVVGADLVQLLGDFEQSARSQ